MNVSIVRSGFLTTVQDLGRTGFRESGVSPGGALDRHALTVANLLVGNDESVAGLEITLGGVQLRFDDDRLIAWCGGDFDVRCSSAAIPAGHVAVVAGGEIIAIDRPRVGCRCWLAISGGIDLPVVLGSRSTDLRAAFGGLEGRVLRDGDKILLGQNSTGAKNLMKQLSNKRLAHWKPPHDWCSSAKREVLLRFLRGSDCNRVGVSVMQRLTTQAWTVSPDSNRMGVRFEGSLIENIDRPASPELLSEAVEPGTLQLPPGGKPILLLNDCQTIGGYPKIAHVITVDLGFAAQLRAGDTVRFREVSLADAQRFMVERAQQLAQFRRGLEPHLA